LDIAALVFKFGTKFQNSGFGIWGRCDCAR